MGNPATNPDNWTLAHTSGENETVSLPISFGLLTTMWLIARKAQSLKWTNKVRAQLALEADFSADVVTGNAPLLVQFTDLTIGGTPTAWSWKADDVEFSTAQNPLHSFPEGLYTISLVVSNVFSADVEQKSNYINVGPVVVGGQRISIGANKRVTVSGNIRAYIA